MTEIKNKIITFFSQSSEDSTKTSATLTGILIMIASYIHQYLDFVPVVNTFYNSPIGHNLDPILTALGGIIGGIWFLFGLGRKLSNKIEQNAGLRVE